MTPEIEGNPLRPWQLWTVILGAVSLLLSGCAWWAVSHLGHADPDELPGPAVAWLNRWHGLSAMVGVFAAGVVASSHVGQGLRLGARRPTGTALVTLGGLAALSGFVLAYLVPERWHGLVGTAHAGAGIAAFGLLMAHRRGPPPGLDR